MDSSFDDSIQYIHEKIASIVWDDDSITGLLVSLVKKLLKDRLPITDYISNRCNETEHQSILILSRVTHE